MSSSSAAFFAENFAGTVSVFAGAPGTAKAPLTNTAFAGGPAFGGGCCWAAARPTLPTNASASALVHTRSHRMAVSFYALDCTTQAGATCACRPRRASVGQTAPAYGLMQQNWWRSRL